jgi:hypothetical protein
MNVYYYVFYVFAKLARRINKKEDYAMYGLMWLSALIFFNIFPIVGLIIGREAIHSAPKLIGAGSIILVGLINYFILIKDKKKEKIIEFYDDKYKYKKLNRWSIILIVLYVLGTLSIAFYIATLIRAQSL